MKKIFRIIVNGVLIGIIIVLFVVICDKFNKRHDEIYEYIGKKIEIEGKSYTIMSRDWIRSSYILDNGQPIDGRLAKELLKQE